MNRQKKGKFHLSHRKWRESQKVYSSLFGRSELPFIFLQKTCQFIPFDPEKYFPVDSFLFLDFLFKINPPLFFIYNILKLLCNIICSKIEQIGKGLDFKSLLQRFICFIHRFLTGAVEKIREEGLPQSLRP